MLDLDGLLKITSTMDSADVEALNTAMIDGTVDQLINAIGSFRVIWPSRIDDMLVDSFTDAAIRGTAAVTLPMRLATGEIRPIVIYNGDILLKDGGLAIVAAVAHESVHVRQIWEGLLGSPDSEWSGLTDTTEYSIDIMRAVESGNWEVVHKYPWEIEAYGVQYHVMCEAGMMDRTVVADMLRIFYEVYPGKYASHIVPLWRKRGVCAASVNVAGATYAPMTYLS